MYTVKSAYRLLAEEGRSKRDHSESRACFSDAIDPHWQKLWRCKVPPKVKVFLWRVSHKFIPSRANLHRRHIDPLSTCDTCGASIETTFHALTECTYARCFWVRLKELTGIKLPNLDPRTWTEQLLDDQFCQERDRGIILCGMWSIWRARNDRRIGKAPIVLKSAVDWALDVCFHLMHVGNEQTPTARERVPRCWQRPPADHVKINTDGAFNSETCAGATGAVIRTNDGGFLLASARILKEVSSALVTEAEACRDGVRLAFSNTEGCPPGDRLDGVGGSMAKQEGAAI